MRRVYRPHRSETPTSIGYDRGMRLRLLAFASATDLLGSSQVEIELPAEATVGDLRHHLIERERGFARLAPKMAIAVAGELAEDSRRLADGDEVALLPPVSGG